jgi:ribosomal protein L11 methyltransferase
MRELVRVAIRVPSTEVEAAIAQLLELAPEGFEECGDGQHVELAVYADPAQAARLRTRFADAAIEEVAAGWEDSWRAFHRGARVGDVWIGPPWETPPDAPVVVVIDPGRAFGTGSHPTTRLCLELLGEVERRGSLLDVGCGSGVLSIAGALLGFDPVVAADSDPVALEVTLANAAANDVRVSVFERDALHDELPAADVAVVNIAADVVESVLRRLDVSVAVTSGYLERDVPTAPRWTHVGRRTRDGWAGDVFCRR